MKIYRIIIFAMLLFAKMTTIAQSEVYLENLCISYSLLDSRGLYCSFDTTNWTVKIIKSDEKYSGDIIIPEGFYIATKHGFEYVTVTKISSDAFRDCSDITSVTISKTVKEIYDDTFKDCTSLATVEMSSGVKKIGRNAFENCSSLTSIKLSTDITYIGRWAFKGCSSLTSINVPNSVTEIGSNAFQDCSSLTSINIPKSVTHIYEAPFLGCSNLTSVTLNNNALVSKNYKLLSSIKEVFGEQVTEYILGKDVTSIGDYTFNSCSGLTSITIPSNVTSIGERAFQGCNGITSIKVESGNIKYDSREDCNAIIETATNSLILGCFNTSIPNSVTSIGDYAFSTCKNLTSVDIPNSVTSIGNNAFSGCSGLTSVSIPNGVTSIGKDAFYACNNLTSVSIPSSVTSIGDDAFWGCRNIQIVNIDCEEIKNWFSSFPKEVMLGNNVRFIAEKAFWSNTSLSFITISNSITSIGDYAFGRCNGLKDVYCYAEKIPTTTMWTFYDANIKDATLHVSATSIEMYKADEVWGQFGKIVAIKPFHTLTYLVNGEVYTSMEMEEDKEIIAEEEPTKEGYTFSGWSEIPAKMPNKDVIVTGAFSANKYKLTYLVDGETYKLKEVEFGTIIITENDPTKDGYTFSGWSEIPATMPAKDITVTGTFTINKYKLTYMVDGETYKTTEVEFGAPITEENEPTKEGYTFSGWSMIPTIMPAMDVIITGSFTKGEYQLTYVVDGEPYKTICLDYGTRIIAEMEPEKQGYTFSGWSEIPAKMPAKNVTVTGSFTINRYRLIYMLGDETYKTYDVEYGTDITPEAEPMKEGYTFSGWSGIPTTMSSMDVTVTGSFIPNKYKLTYIVDGEIYNTYEVEYGANIVPEVEPTKEGYTFSGWNEIPTTMPAEDVTVTGSFTFVDAITDVNADSVPSIKKVFRNGKIIIIRDGKEYDTNGTLLK